MTIANCPDCNKMLFGRRRCQCGWQEAVKPAVSAEAVAKSGPCQCSHEYPNGHRCLHVGSIGRAGSELRRCTAHDMLKYDSRRDDYNFVNELMKHVKFLIKLNHPKGAVDYERRFGTTELLALPKDSPLKFLLKDRSGESA